ncbi:Gfo/Idh/MocA family oxidoreductase [soil metagenome]
MTDHIRWGIAATGGIATSFATDLARLDDAALVAVGSRTAERAEAFGDQFDIARRHGSLDDLAADDDVDVVYVASPHVGHCDTTLRFVEAGKAVLCEKPFAMNHAQAGRMVDAARAHQVFLMEAVWSRFLPAYVTLRELLAAGRIGRPVLVQGDFGMAMELAPGHRLVDNALGGGSLLDLGIYPLQLATMVLGPASDVTAFGWLGDTDVDEYTVVGLHHDRGGHSVSTSSFTTALPNEGLITGTEGVIVLPDHMHSPDHLTVTVDGATERVDAAYEGKGLRFQAAAVNAHLRAGDLESDVMPLDETLRLAAIMDEARRQLGLRYPADN